MILALLLDRWVEVAPASVLLRLAELLEAHGRVREDDECDEREHEGHEAEHAPDVLYPEDEVRERSAGLDALP